MLLTFHVNLNNLGQANDENKVFLYVIIPISMVDVCLGVYESWSNSRVDWNKRGIHGGKKHTYAFFTNEDGKFRRKRISKAEGIRLKLHGFYKKRKYICEICSSRFFVLSKNFKEKVECPVCN